MTTLPEILQYLDDLHLLLGRHSGEHAAPVNDGSQGPLVERPQQLERGAIDDKHVVLAVNRALFAFLANRGGDREEPSVSG